jgi:hypothetical protein
LKEQFEMTETASTRRFGQSASTAANNVGRSSAAEHLAAFSKQLPFLEAGQPPEVGGDSIDQLALELLSCNFGIWNAESRVRAARPFPAVVAQLKQEIDVHNLTRHNLIESLDAAFAEEISGADADETAFPVSESLGQLVDRLTVVSLRLFHHDAAARRHDLSPTARQNAAERSAWLAQQTEYLCRCFDETRAGLADGTVAVFAYRQLKLYTEAEIEGAAIS